MQALPLIYKYQADVVKMQSQAEIDGLRKECEVLARKLAIVTVVPGQAALAAASSALGGDATAMGNDYAILANPALAEEKIFGYASAWSAGSGAQLVQAELENRHLIADTKYLARGVRLPCPPCRERANPTISTARHRQR